MNVVGIDGSASAGVAAAVLAAFVLSAGLTLALSLRYPTDIAASGCDIGPAPPAPLSRCSDAPPEGFGSRLLASRTRMTEC